MSMKGPFTLNARTINYMVTKESPGVYILLKQYNGSPKYVGRADNDLNHRLHKWSDKGYKYFLFDYCSSAEEAFRLECELYHQHKQTLENNKHPERPEDTVWECPKCNIFSWQIKGGQNKNKNE